MSLSQSTHLITGLRRVPCIYIRTLRTLTLSSPLPSPKHPSPTYFPSGVPSRTLPPTPSPLPPRSSSVGCLQSFFWPSARNRESRPSQLLPRQRTTRSRRRPTIGVERNSLRRRVHFPRAKNVTRIRMSRASATALSRIISSRVYRATLPPFTLYAPLPDPTWPDCSLWPPAVRAHVIAPFEAWALWSKICRKNHSYMSNAICGKRASF